MVLNRGRGSRCPQQGRG